MVDGKNFRKKNIRLPRTCYLGQQWYFLTACTQNRAPRLRDPKLVSRQLDLLVETSEKNSFSIVAYCFMPDHLHLLAGGTSETSDCLAFMRAYKQKSGYAFQQSTGVYLWQTRFYDHILRPSDRWESVAYYIWSNPVRKGLCAHPEDWPFSGSRTVDWKPLLKQPDLSWTPPWKPSP